MTTSTTTIVTIIIIVTVIISSSTSISSSIIIATSTTITTIISTHRLFERRHGLTQSARLLPLRPVARRGAPAPGTAAFAVVAHRERGPVGVCLHLGRHACALAARQVERHGLQVVLGAVVPVVGGRAAVELRAELGVAVQHLLRPRGKGGHAGWLDTGGRPGPGLTSSLCLRAGRCLGPNRVSKHGGK